MILSDVSIYELAVHGGLITPFSVDQLQPASYDLLLGEIDSQDWLIQPGQFLLACTVEEVCLPNNIVGRLEGKSSWAREGLIVHTAGFIDPGFRGQLVLEITNLSRTLVKIAQHDRIAQIAFHMLDREAACPYGSPGLGSHYQGQSGVTKSWRNR